MDANIRLELLRMTAEREPARSIRDLMTITESLVTWIESSRFPEEAEDTIADCTADRKPA
jgi:hypothetical protein